MHPYLRELRNKKIINMYISGVSVAKIADSLKICKLTVYRILHKKYG